MTAVTDEGTRDRPQSAAAPVAVPADRRLRVPVRLPHGRARRAGRRDRLAVHPELRLAERLRQPPRPPGRLLPLRPVRHLPPDGAGLRARDERLRDDLEDADGLGRRARRADARPAGSRGHRHAAHAAAGRRRRRPHARAHGRVPRRTGRGRPRLRARLRLRPDAGDLDAGRRSEHAADAIRSRRDLQARLGSRDRRRGRVGPRTPRARGRRPGVLRPVVGRGARRAAERRRGGGADRRDDALLAQVAEQGADPGSPPARPGPALGADDQGPDLHADRRDGGGAHDLAPRDAGRRAELGLPLHVDPGHDLHPPGAPLPQPRLGSGRVHGVRRRPRADRGRLAPDHVRHRRTARPARDDPRRPDRLLRRLARCGSATAPSTSARTTSSALCSTRSCSTRGTASGCRGASGRSCRRRPSARRRSGATRTRGSGRHAASRSTTSPRS